MANNDISNNEELNILIIEAMEKKQTAYNDHVIIEWDKISEDLYKGVFYINDIKFTTDCKRLLNNDWIYGNENENISLIKNISDRGLIIHKIQGTLDKNIKGFFDVVKPNSIIYNRKCRYKTKEISDKYTNDGLLYLEENTSVFRIIPLDISIKNDIISKEVYDIFMERYRNKEGKHGTR